MSPRGESERSCRGVPGDGARRRCRHDPNACWSQNISPSNHAGGEAERSSAAIGVKPSGSTLPRRRRSGMRTRAAGSIRTSGSDTARLLHVSGLDKTRTTWRWCMATRLHVALCPMIHIRIKVHTARHFATSCVPSRIRAIRG